ncbi:TPA: flagellar hook-associated protein FlgK [Escherichia coli]|nr:flagellar hook-associated protein FlgK [Escherichia coli]
MSAIANNIANVNTTGFKRDRVMFQDLFYQTQEAPGAMLDQNNIMPTGLQFGSGVRIVGTQKTFTEGNVETTDNAMNVAIMGQGFLQVQKANGDNASALYDARDQMVEELSGMMDVQVNIDDQGNYNVTLKNGQPLVSGQQSSTIALETNADGTPTMSLTFAGTTSTMTTDTGGSLGALFDYQNDVLTPLTDTINSMASQFADAVNNQLAQGYDLNGNPGEPLFIYDASNADGPLTVNPDITADELAFSSSPDESGNSDNLQALINISTEPLEIANLGSVTVGQACSSIISNIGIYSQQNQTEVDAASNVYSAAQNQQSSVSGVSMDEEAVNLITYQQIYEANLKVISAGAEIFDSVLEMCS